MRSELKRITSLFITVAVALTAAVQLGIVSFADGVRNDCNQVWKLTGAHDGVSGVLVPLGKRVVSPPIGEVEF